MAGFSWVGSGCFTVEAAKSHLINFDQKLLAGLAGASLLVLAFLG